MRSGFAAHHNARADNSARRGRYSANVSAANHSGASPLHLACKFGRLGVARLLVQHGAEFDATDVEGRSPLHYAYSERHAKATLLSMYMQYTTGGQGASVSVRESATKLMGSLSSSINNPMMIHMDSDMEDQVQLLYPCLQLYLCTC